MLHDIHMVFFLVRSYANVSIRTKQPNDHVVSFADVSSFFARRSGDGQGPMAMSSKMDYCHAGREMHSPNIFASASPMDRRIPSIFSVSIVRRELSKENFRAVISLTLLGKVEVDLGIEGRSVGEEDKSMRSYHAQWCRCAFLPM